MFPVRPAEHRRPRRTEDLTQAARLCARAPYPPFLDAAQEAYVRNVALSVGAPRSEISGNIAGACGAIGDVGGSQWYERLRQEEDRFLDERHARIEESRARSRAPYGGRTSGSRVRSPGAATTRNQEASAAAVPQAFAGYVPMQRQAPSAAGTGRPAPAQFGRAMTVGAWPSGGVPAPLAPAPSNPATFAQFGGPRYPRRARGTM
jgi:hypothetical protein